jgi:hypothetical protein
MSRFADLARRRAGLWALALACFGAAASGEPRDPGPVKCAEPSMNNRQVVNRSPGDRSTVEQSVTPRSCDNQQSATTSSLGSSNVIVQSIDGRGNTQAAQQSGRDNVAVQTQAGSGNRQSIRQDGGGNTAVQSQSGVGLEAHVAQGGGETDVQSQR